MTQLIEVPQRGTLGVAQGKISQQITGFTREAIKQGYADWATQLKPTALLTLTVNNGHQRAIVSDSSFIRSVNNLIHYLNCDLFGRKYKQKNLGLLGFGCIEHQENGQPHVHIAIANEMPSDQFSKLKRLLDKKLSKVKLLGKEGADFRPIRRSDEDFHKVGAYLAKEMHMLTLGPEGLN